MKAVKAPWLLYCLGQTDKPSRGQKVTAPVNLVQCSLSDHLILVCACFSVHICKQWICFSWVYLCWYVCEGRGHLRYIWEAFYHFVCSVLQQPCPCTRHREQSLWTKWCFSSPGRGQNAPVHFFNPHGTKSSFMLKLSTLLTVRFQQKNDIRPILLLE